MSGGKACTCEKKDKSNWLIINYKCNYSAFQYPKYAQHPSDYSTIECTNCGMVWRTNANYVDELAFK